MAVTESERDPRVLAGRRAAVHRRERVWCRGGHIPCLLLGERVHSEHGAQRVSAAQHPALVVRVQQARIPLGQVADEQHDDLGVGMVSHGLREKCGIWKWAGMVNVIIMGASYSCRLCDNRGMKTPPPPLTGMVYIKHSGNVNAVRDGASCSRPARSRSTISSATCISNSVIGKDAFLLT